MMKLCHEVFAINNSRWQSCRDICLLDVCEKSFQIDSQLHILEQFQCTPSLAHVQAIAVQVQCSSYSKLLLRFPRLALLLSISTNLLLNHVARSIVIVFYNYCVYSIVSV